MKRFLLLALALVSACAPVSTTATVHASPNYVTQAQLQSAKADGHVNLYEAISYTRPTILRAVAGEEPTVFLGKVRMVGGMDALKAVDPDQVKSVRRYGSGTAPAEYGTVSGPIIVVELK